MARLTLTAQLAAARAECEQLRKLNSEWACQSAADRRTILRLKAQQPRVTDPVGGATNKRAAYGVPHNVVQRYFAANPDKKSASADEIRAFAAQH